MPYKQPGFATHTHSFKEFYAERTTNSFNSLNNTRITQNTTYSEYGNYSKGGYNTSNSYVGSRTFSPFGRK